MDKIDIYETLNRSYFSNEMDEKEVIQHLPILLKSTKTFVDIGASLGQYTYFANQQMRNGKIVAIEADPIRYEKLSSNVTKWMISSTNEIRCIKGAVSDEVGRTSFYTTNSNVSGGLFKHDLAHLHDVAKSNVAWSEIKVDSFTLDCLFQNEFPECIKIDVEGSELRVLKGSQNILEKGTPLLLIEIHNWTDPKSLGNRKNVSEYLKHFGYNSTNFFGKTLFSKNLMAQLPLFWFMQHLSSIFTLPKRSFYKLRKALS